MKQLGLLFIEFTVNTIPLTFYGLLLEIWILFEIKFVIRKNFLRYSYMHSIMGMERNLVTERYKNISLYVSLFNKHGSNYFHTSFKKHKLLNIWVTDQGCLSIILEAKKNNIALESSMRCLFYIEYGKCGNISFNLPHQAATLYSGLRTW